MRQQESGMRSREIERPGQVGGTRERDREKERMEKCHGEVREIRTREEIREGFLALEGVGLPKCAVVLGLLIFQKGTNLGYTHREAQLKGLTIQRRGKMSG